MPRNIRTEDDLRAALFRCGESVFHICYLHAKRSDDTLALMTDVFQQYALCTKKFSSENARRLWLLKTTHNTCMDWYAQKLRRKPTRSLIQRWGEEFPFMVSREMADLMRLHYTYLTPLSLCFGDGESADFAAKVTARPAALIKSRLQRSARQTKLSEQDICEWLETILMPDDFVHRILLSIRKAADNPHFSLQAGAASFKRNLHRAAPYIALGILVLCFVAAISVRMDWYGLGDGQASDPFVENSGGASSAARPEPTPEADIPQGELAKLDAAVFVPNDTGLTEYVIKDMDASASVLVQELAAHGAFPETVALENLTYLKDGEPVASLRSGEQVEVRLYFSADLQSYLDEAEDLSVLVATVKSFGAFYESVQMPLYAVEVYSGGEPVSVGGQQVNCTVLLKGELPITEVIEE